MQTYPPVQVILAQYETTSDVLINFDVDVCAFAFDPRHSTVSCTPRGFRGLMHGTNVVDSNMGSVAYCTRLEKYAQRGFAIAVPGLKPHLLRSDVWLSEYIYVTCCDLLLRVEERTQRTEELLLPYPEPNNPRMISAKTTSTVKASAVAGLHRLLVMDAKERVAKFTQSDKYYEASIISRSDTAVVVEEGANIFTVLVGSFHALSTTTGHSDVINDEHVSTVVRDAYSIQSRKNAAERTARVLRSRLLWQLRSQSLEDLCLVGDPDHSGQGSMQDTFSDTFRVAYGSACQITKQQHYTNQPQRFVFYDTRTDTRSDKIKYINDRYECTADHAQLSISNNRNDTSGSTRTDMQPNAQTTTEDMNQEPSDSESGGSRYGKRFPDTNGSKFAVPRTISFKKYSDMNFRGDWNKDWWADVYR